ncbi:MAG: response regulator [Persicimonas sp.]
MGGGSQQSQDNSGIRVLVVDGRPKRSAAVRKALEAAPAPFVVSPARRLWSAIQILAGMSIDAVVLGLDLPDTDGDSALRDLRVQAPQVPVLVIGEAQSQSGGTVDADGQPADDYLSADDLDPNTLGLRILEAIERCRPAEPAVEEPASEPEVPAARILLVEDESLVQRLLRRNLERHGYVVEVVSSPQEALAWSQQTSQHIDLLICDEHPPGMDGERLSHHLQRSFPDMLTLLLSSTKPDREQRPGFGILPRPYSLDDFARVVDKLLGAEQPTPA